MMRHSASTSSRRVNSCIAAHRVEQQSFVCNRPLRPKARLIREVGLNRHRPHLRSGSLRVECDRNSLVRLNANCDDIRINNRRRGRKQCLWRRFEMHANLRQISCKTFPSPDVERNSCPTPVLNLKLYGCVTSVNFLASPEEQTLSPWRTLTTKETLSLWAKRHYFCQKCTAAGYFTFSGCGDQNLNETRTRRTGRDSRAT
jgi:hypothetical protein